MRRKGVGAARASKQVYSKKAQELQTATLETAVETVQLFEKQLTDFARKHRARIQQDPAFRAEFLKMCVPLGVDPLSSEKGFLGGILGIGDFYYELAVKVAEVCIAGRSRNGGIMSVSEVHSILMKRGTRFNNFQSKSQAKNEISHDDILIAVSKLSKLGSGFRVVNVGKSCHMIVSVPQELDNDHMVVLELAENKTEGNSNHQLKLKGSVTRKELKEYTQWDDIRIDRVITMLLSECMVWIDHDEINNIDRYWFPSLWKTSQESLG